MLIDKTFFFRSLFGGVRQISEAVGAGASFLARVFKQEIGVTIHACLNQYRILRSPEFLKTKSVTESGYLCGFSDTSHFPWETPSLAFFGELWYNDFIEDLPVAETRKETRDEKALCLY